MTTGAAMVARTKVRRTGLVSLRDGPMVRFSAVSVGKTAIQIMRASWCFEGGPTGRTGPADELTPALGAGLGMVKLLRSRGWCAGSAGCWSGTVRPGAACLGARGRGGVRRGARGAGAGGGEGAGEG